MSAHKRKRTPLPDTDGLSSDSEKPFDSDIDISSALTGRKQKRSHVQQTVEDDDDDLQELIRDTISKRDVKGGTQLLKKTKGKAKMTTGEIGGGSFQNMGALDVHSFTTL